MNVLIGTGFHCTEETRAWKMELLRLWFWNTRKVFPTEKIVIVASAPLSLSPHDLAIYNGTPDKSVPMPVVIQYDDAIRTPTYYEEDRKHFPNLCTPKLCGWSMSWIIPAMVAYSESKDFIYKEQDCMAFGDWHLPLFGEGCFKIGSSQSMCSEQSLFYILHWTILQIVHDYLAINRTDCEMDTEEKFRILTRTSRVPSTHLPFGVGRDRPFPQDKEHVAWYFQKVKHDKDFIAEVLELKKLGLLGYPQPT